MTRDRYSKELVLTVEDFAECGWRAILANAPDIGYPSMHLALSNAAKQAASEDRQTHSKALWLLADACSMIFSSASVNDPFKPFMEIREGRSTILDDLSETDLTFFRKIVKIIDDPWLKARLSDLVWLRHRDSDCALQAIDSYQEIALNAETHIHDALDCWQRAINLARMLGRTTEDRLARIEDSIIQGITGATEQEIGLCLRLACLLKSQNLGKNSSLVIAEKLESLANRLDSIGDFVPAVEGYRASADWFQLSSDPTKSAAMTAKWAESSVKQAEASISSNQPSNAVAACFYERAIQIYRRILKSERTAHRVDARIAELRVLLTEAGERSLEEVQVVKSSEVNITQLVEQARNAVRDKKQIDALRAFTSLSGDLDVKEMKRVAIENRHKYPLSHLFPRYLISPDGRTVAKDFGNTEQSTLFHIIHDYYLIHINLAVPGSIWPALQVLLLEHRLREFDFIYLAGQSPIVPIGREELFGKALFAGYERDLVAALHILVPQIEHMVRFHLKQVGAKTTHLDPNGIETENGLTTLMGLPETEKVFGENVTFEIQALFCHPSGPNLRNNLAHGLLDAQFCYSVEVLYAWWFSLKLVFNMYWNTLHKDIQSDEGKGQ